MKYFNADSVLPDELLTEVQRYVCDGLIYIPKPKSSHKKWGENTGVRTVTQQRNAEIRRRYINGSAPEQLADEFYLSLSSIRKIVYSKT